MPELSAIFAAGEKPGLAVFLMTIVLAIFAAIAVHELGHLLTGMAQGFRFQLFVVGPLGIKREHGGIKIFLNKNVGYMGGVAATVPAKQEGSNRKKFAISILAGPVASLLFALACFILLPVSHGAFRAFCLIAGTCSAGLFLATTLPRKSGVFFTDRVRFQRMISKGKEGLSEAALLELLTHQLLERSCKNIDPAKARVLQDDPEDFIRFWGYYYEYLYSLENDLPQKTEAAEKLAALKNSVPAAVWKALQIDS